MSTSEDGLGEAGRRGKIAGQTDAAHTAAVFGEGDVGGEGVFGVRSGEMAVVVKAEELLVEGWVVGKNAGWVVVDFEAVNDGFDDDTFLAIGDNPVEVGRRKLETEGDIG